MEKLKRIEKSVLSQLRAGRKNMELLRAEIQIKDINVQQMLFWSTICAVWSYLTLIIIIARIYLRFNGSHSALLISSLLIIYCVVGVVIWSTWKKMAYSRSKHSNPGKTYLHYQLGKLIGQRRLIGLYLADYTLIAGVSAIFFYIDVKNGTTELIKIIGPVSVITYLAGVYFIVNFSRQIQVLKLENKRMDHIAFIEKIQQN